MSATSESPRSSGLLEINVIPALTSRAAFETLEQSNKEVTRMALPIGSKPGVGRYCCTHCNWSVYLNDPDDALPPCGNCGKGQQTEYNRC
jgi:hypothetical protein